MADSEGELPWYYSNSLNAFAQQLAATTTFGLAPKATAALAAIPSRGNSTYGERYQAARELDEEQRAKLSAQHPVSNALGWGAGLYTGGKAVEAVLPEALSVAEGGSKMLNIAKNALLGGGTSAAENAIENSDNPSLSTGQKVSDALTAGGLGAVGGAVVGPVVGAVAGAAGRGASKAASLIAKKIGTTPEELLQRVANFRAQTGREPAIVDLLTPKEAAGVKSIANKNPNTAAELQAYSQQVENQSPQQVSGIVSRATPTPAVPKYFQNVNPQDLNPNTLTEAQRAAADTAFSAARTAPAGNLPPELASNPTVMEAIRREAPSIQPVGSPAGTPTPRAKIEALMNGQQPAQPLTIGEWDTIRQGLRDRQPTGNENAKDFGTIADTISSWLGGPAGQRTQYGQALDDYADADKFRLAFQHGYKGGTPATVSKENADVADALRSPQGLEGLRAGRAVNLRDKAAESIAGARDVVKEGAAQTARNAAYNDIVGQPNADQMRSGLAAEGTAAASRAASGGAVTAGDDAATGTKALLHGTAYAAVGAPHSATYSLVRGALDALTQTHFTPEIQQRIGAALTGSDPALRDQALRVLQAGIQRNQMLSRVPGAAAAVGGGQIGNALTSQFRGALPATNQGDEWFSAGAPAAPAPAQQAAPAGDQSEWY